MRLLMRPLTGQQNEAMLLQTSQSHNSDSLIVMLTHFRYGHALVQFDAQAEARLRRKIDFFIVPTVSLLYLFCFIDRANIG
jgi:hypothetical protein